MQRRSLITLNQYKQSMFIALDTEFVWQRTYYANLGLIQAGMSTDFDRSLLPSSFPEVLPFNPKNEEQRSVLLLDPLKSDGKYLAAIVADRSIVKIFHDAVQDLQHIRHWCGADPANIFDTRIAAGFCGMPSILSLRQLLINTQGIELPKTETRTDWVRRPLSLEQLEYAADDVAYMGRVMEILIAKAKELGTYDWMMEEMLSLDDLSKYTEEDSLHAWKRMKVPVTAFKQPRQLIRLRELAAWREQTARERNLPRSWVVDDKVLVNVALNPPAHASQIPANELPRPFAAAFFEMLAVAEQMPEENIPELTPTASIQMREIADQVIKAIAAEATKVQVDPALFGSRADITSFCQNPDNPDHPLNRGWRHQVVGSLARNVVGFI